MAERQMRMRSTCDQAKEATLVFLRLMGRNEVSDKTVHLIAGAMEVTLEAVKAREAVLREETVFFLTPAQYKTLVLLIHGHTYQKVAEKFNILPESAKYRCIRLYRTLGVKTRVEAAILYDRGCVYKRRKRRGIPTSRIVADCRAELAAKRSR